MLKKLRKLSWFAIQQVVPISMCTSFDKYRIGLKIYAIVTNLFLLTTKLQNHCYNEVIGSCYKAKKCYTWKFIYAQTNSIGRLNNLLNESI